ncbi:MAG: ATP-dependent DNA helicase RecG [Cyanobacteria bacterium NC_groundwater_1444_Ag_S-0.65um_54_12]|nr:ATP-dependent DNA helicase RecG [Cyanobacteria bacterium NC_groundwater_1444_Ag_S-0.65um_54_12]
MTVADTARLLAALAAEERHAYCDLQGRHARFSEFMQMQISELSGQLLTNTQRARLEQLHGKFAMYRQLDLLARRELIGRIRAVLPSLIVGNSELSASSATNKVPEADQPAAEAVPSYVENWPLAGRIKGIGPYLQSMLERLGIRTVRELLAHYPRHYLDYQHRVSLRDLRPGATVTIWGVLRRVEVFSPERRPNLTICTLWISDETGKVSARWFMGHTTQAQRETWKKRFPLGHGIILSGEAKIDSYGKYLVFERPETEVIGPGEDVAGADSLHVGRIVPVYALTEGLQQKTLRRIIHQLLVDLQSQLRETLPGALRRQYGLCDRPAALKSIHFPASLAERDTARHRLIFEELFWLQLGLAFKRTQLARQTTALSLPPKNGGMVEQLLATLPFELTGAQKRAFSEIRQDLANDTPMNRLVQGDVGSGKTVVALLALLVALDNGYQSVLMAPTEILAEQHFQTCQELLRPLGIEIALLLGKQSKRDREIYLRALQTGFCPIAIGTHALIQAGVEFQRLGLAIIDEQHRFGVRQRALLRAKGQNVEVLTMTATPIPRTLAMVLYGDLDVSLIDELPPGRQPVLTHWSTGRNGHRQAWELIANASRQGHQAYIVFPLVAESEKLDLRAATCEYERLRTKELKDFRLGLLHGQMAAEEKETVIGAFRRQELDVLVATTVIEVGVDVPNATVMVIENAERFGLSQLHQLRGRVGRGAAASHCILLTDSRASDATRSRMEIMCATQNGFSIAEKDLELRGPGEFLGARQSGLPDLVLANLATDGKLLEAARTAAQQIIAHDPELTAQPDLKAGMLAAYAQHLDFLGVG